MHIIYKIGLLFMLVFLWVACQQNHEHATGQAGLTYTCPMHPQILKKAPGACPICHMDLVPVRPPAAAAETAIMLSDTQIRLGNITTQPVQTRKNELNTYLTGRLVPDETEVDLISSRAAGRIEKLHVKEIGVRIRQGQPLYELYSEDLLTLEREYLLTLEQSKAAGPAKTQFAAFLEASRQKLLLYGLTEKQIEKLGRTNRPNARVTYLAPRTGIVTALAAAEGMYVPEGGLLYTLANLSKIWVEAELYASETNTVEPGDVITVSVPNAAPITTRVAFINPEFQQNQQVILLRAAIPNPGGQLFPGTPATITLTNTTASQPVLPQEAVIRTAAGAHVWVKTARNTFTPRVVTLGEASTNQIAVTQGLMPSDTVVTTGAYLLYSEYVLKNGNKLPGQPPR